jgi:hypothetical protein
VYFNLGEDEKHTVDLKTYKTCRFIKVIPTGFRSQPINYADCQEFNKDQAELQFFGACGYLCESLVSETPKNQNYAYSAELDVALEVSVLADDKEIAHTNHLTIQHFRGSSQL